MFSTTLLCRINCPMMRTALIATLFTCFVFQTNSQNATGPTLYSKNIKFEITIPVGGSANITCSSDTFDSSTFNFSEEFNDKRLILDEQLIILNNSTAVLEIKNANQGHYMYKCKSNENLISSTYLHVVYAPSNVTDFKCRINNFDNLTCSFNKSLYTTYNICYGFEIHKCKHKCNPIIKNNKVNCELTKTMNSKYEDFYAPKEIYYFNVEAYNGVPPNTSQWIKIYALDSVFPGNLDVKLDNITTNSSTLHWKLNSYYSDVQLVYEICTKPKDLDSRCRTELKTKQQPKTQQYIKYKLDLEYPGYEYELSMRAKVETNRTNNTEWSETFKKTFSTMGQHPDRPPRTDVGCFYNDSMLHLYWQELKTYEHNGPNFKYIISDDKLMNISTTETTLQLNWDGIENRKFFIKSSNQFGESEDESIIYVPAKRRDIYEPTDVQKVYQENKSYKLIWKHPQYYDRLLNYTIFWCNEKRSNLQGCEDSINFTHVDKLESTFITEPDDRILNLAISANYANYSTGMVWALCQGSISQSLIKPDVKKGFSNATAISIEWNIGYICKSIISGYSLTYCELNRVGNETCLEAQIDSGFIQNYTIKNLKPYTNYSINMSMSRDKQNGPISDDLIVTTREAAPSAPRNLQYDEFSISNTTVDISWRPPKEFNGIIRNYTIIIKNSSAQVVSERVLPATEPIENERINYTLTGLSSYTDYVVAVTATTNENSVESNNITFKTKIGKPSEPTNLISILKKGIFKWEEPNSRAGRLEFYAVMVTFTYNNRTTVETSLVKGNECKFSFSFCFETLSFKVRAVNFAESYEINDKIIGSKGSLIYPLKDKQLKENENFNCENSISWDDPYKFFDPNISDIYIQQHEEKGFRFYASKWEDDKRVYEKSCGGPNWEKNSIPYLFASMFLIIFITFSSHKAFEQYKKMSAIKPILPNGLGELGDHTTNSKYQANAIVYDNDCPKDITISSDNLIKNREESRLLSICSGGFGGIGTQRQLSSNSENSIDVVGDTVNVGRRQSFDNASDYALNAVDEHSNVSSCDEQYSTRSTDSVEMNDVSSLSNNRIPIPQQTEQNIVEEEDANMDSQQQQPQHQGLQHQQPTPNTVVTTLKMNIAIPRYVTLPPNASMLCDERGYVIGGKLM